MKSERLISLVLALQRGSNNNAPELARELGVSVRTIFRDLDALSRLGIPVHTLAGRGGGVRLPSGYRTNLAMISAAEAEALALLGTPAAGKAAPLAALETAVQKLAAALPAAHQARAQHARQRMLFDTRPWFRSARTPPLLEQLRGAVWQDRCIRASYPARDGNLQQLRLEPHALVVKVDTWYLVARERKRMKVFRVSRLAEVSVESTGFTRLAGFDLARFWGSWRDEFERHPPNHYYVELEITPQARTQLLADHGSWLGSVLEPLSANFKQRVITLDLQREAIAASVLTGVAGSIRIRGPAALRERLRATARELLRATRGKPLQK